MATYLFDLELTLSVGVLPATRMHFSSGIQTQLAAFRRGETKGSACRSGRMQCHQCFQTCDSADIKIFITLQAFPVLPCHQACIEVAYGGRGHQSIQGNGRCRSMQQPIAAPVLATDPPSPWLARATLPPSVPLPGAEATVGSRYTQSCYRLPRRIDS